MISVPNLHQRLNGNSLFFFFLALLFLNSCDPLKKIPKADKPETEQELEAITGGKIYDPQTGTFVNTGPITPTETLDTTEWTILPKLDYPPIYSTTTSSTGGEVPVKRIRIDQYGSEVLSSYNVSLLLPFMTQSFTPEATVFSESSNWALQYYCGTKIALEDLESKGLALKLNVLDTKGSLRELNNLIRENEALKNSHLLIGPNKSELVPALLDFAAQTDKVLVAPNHIPEKPFSNKPNYIQVKPGFKTHCQALTQDALRKYRPDQIVVVARSRASELEGMAYIQEEFKKLTAGTEAQLREYVINLDDETSSVFESIDVLPFISLTDTTVFILPSWSNESFVFAFLRKLDLSRENEEAVVVYGLPQWMRYERIDFDYYSKLNVHISQNLFLDPFSPEAQAFKETFFRRYGTMPTIEAYLGYDVMSYFGQMIHKYGTRFQYALESEPENGISMAFDLERLVDFSSGRTENLPIQQFENKHIYILKFQDYNFVPAARY